MKKIKKLSGVYFYGNKASEYAIEKGYLDYATLSRAFDAVLCNDITKLFYSTLCGEYTEPELVNGCEIYEDENGDEITCEIFQYYIISDNGAQILQRYTDELLYYIDSLDVYIWGVAHFGTSWDYILTDIKINTSAEE